jgi:hypothetical protein
MSIIANHVTKYGIVCASDSNVTINRHEVRKAPKIFELKHLTGALSVAGSYGVGDTPMDEWMRVFLLRRETWVSAGAQNQPVRGA